MRTLRQEDGGEADTDRAGTVEALYRTEHGRVVRLAYLLTGDRSAAEEIAQEAFARILTRFEELRRPAAFLTTVTVNLCRDRGRREATAARHPWARPASVGPPDLPREASEIWRSIQRLPPHHREVVVLRYWADLSTRDVARLLGIPAGTVRSQLHRALAALEEELTDAD